MKCKNCEDGFVMEPIPHISYVSHDMAIDAGEPSMEGMEIDEGTEWVLEPCECCNGNFENCEYCTKHKDDF